MASTQDTASVAQGRVLVGFGRLLRFQGEIERAEAFLNHGLAISRKREDAVTTAYVLVTLGSLATQRGAYDRAHRFLEEALFSAAAIGDPVVDAALTGMALANLGLAAHGRGNLEEARARREQSLHISREHGYHLGIVRSLCDLGDVARDQGD
ncbi:MAG: tetratricopeptide repeat protein [Thermomicrobiales bacterium]